tara:strand:+ start:206 stop:844 length:639 start_codon:yes stop_codon:yes gene_type:complete
MSAKVFISLSLRRHKRAMTSYPLQVPTSKDRIYNQFLAIINFLIYEVDKDTTKPSPLTNKELSVLAAIMYYNDRYRKLPQPERSEYIMSTDIRKKIRVKLELKANHLNNIIARLKQKYYLGAPVLNNSQLAPTLDIYLDNNISIEFKLNYAEEPRAVDRKPVKKVQSKPRKSKEPASNGGEIYSGKTGGDKEGGGQPVRPGDSPDSTHKLIR